MPVLKYWDGTQYVQIGGPPGAPGAAGIGVPTGGAAGQQLVKNSPTNYDTAWANPQLPYVPPQAPPASGVNSFQDAAGEVWVSLNGGAWRKARDVLHARVWRNAAFSGTSTMTAIAFDATAFDTYGIWVAAQQGFVVPIQGVWMIVTGVAASATAASQGMNVQVQWNGAQLAQGASSNVSLQNLYTTLSTSANRAPGDKAQVLFNVLAGAALNGIVGNGSTFASCHYLGTL